MRLARARGIALASCTYTMMEPLLFSGSADTRELWHRFDRDGFCWVRMPGAIEIARHAPQRLLEILTGWKPHAAYVDHLDIEGVAGRSTLQIDQHPYLPPALQLLVCMQQACDAGGESLFVDTWRLLAELREARDPLFEQLFSVQRVIAFHDMLWCSPTFSLRAGNLACVHSAGPLRADRVGHAFQALLARQQPVRFRMETGDLLISNNHRMLRACSAFSDIRRHLVRVRAWFHRPLAAPPGYVRRALRVALETEEQARFAPLWLRKRLGFSGQLAGHESYDAEDLISHYRGELAEDLARQAQLIRAHGEIAGGRKAS